ncbi:MAG: hypothetical protein WBD37_15195, partial [Anderseniella sp.]
MSGSRELEASNGLNYEEIEEAVMETTRGRWFLTEFARRNKSADTTILLNAIRRLEDQMLAMPATSSMSNDAARAFQEAEMEMQRLSGPKQISSQDLLNTPDNEANARVLAARLSDITRNLRTALGQPPEILATVIAPELKKLDACVTHQSGLADKLSRTAEMVRRLRNSQSIATDALEEADTKPLIAAETAPDTKPQLTSRIVINKSVPEFVSSDDDIFADDKNPATQAEVQSGQVKETDPTQETSAPPAPLIDLTKLPEIGNDTLNFSNIEVPPIPLTVSDEEESTAAEAPDQEPEAEPAIEVADHQTSRLEQTPDAPEQPTERTFSVVRKPNPQ